MYKNVLPINILIIFLFPCYVQKVNAISCYLASDNTVTETVELETLIFLSGSSDGDIIWNSPSYSKSISCSTSVTENVYVYPFPKRDSETLPSGVKMGLIFDGTDMGTFDTSTTSTAGRKDTEWSVTKNNVGTKTITFQTYLVKDGEGW